MCQRWRLHQFFLPLHTPPAFIGVVDFKNMNNKPEVNGAGQYGIKKERQSG